MSFLFIPPASAKRFYTGRRYGNNWKAIAAKISDPNTRDVFLAMIFLATIKKHKRANR